MLVTRTQDIESSSSPNGRLTQSRRNSPATESRWMVYIDKLMISSRPQNDNEVPLFSKERIRINVSGAKFETFLKTLDRFPDTLLGSPELRLTYYINEQNEYFFNRNREAFEGIFFFYQSPGRLIKPLNVGLKIFIEELRFFKMGDDIINCFMEKLSFKDDSNVEDSSRSSISYKIWNALENPKSTHALSIAFLSMSIILISVVLFCLETVESFKSPDKLRIIERIETFCIIWFTIELILRSITAPRKLVFIKSFLNIIDLLAILPFYITIISNFYNDSKRVSFEYIRVLRLLRVMRIFKLSRHMRILKILGMTFKSSLNELMLLLFVLLIAVVLFSSSVFYADSHFHSIPDAFWWAIITLTNVGYGDLVPITPMGKLIGSLCAICGIIVLALPIPIVVSTFIYFYSLDKENQKWKKIEAQSKIIYSGALDKDSLTIRFASNRVNPAENINDDNK
eukprot:gene19762-21696_t